MRMEVGKMRATVYGNNMLDAIQPYARVAFLHAASNWSNSAG